MKNLYFLLLVLVGSGLSDKGSAAAKWDEVSKGLLKRALEDIKKAEARP